MNKETFAAYANSVTLTKMLLLMEDDPLTAGASSADGQLSQLYSDLTGSPYDFSLLNLNGNHGGNVLTATLPGVADGKIWMTSIDADEVWRQDNYTVNNSLYRISQTDSPTSLVEYEASGLTPGDQYKIYVSWQANVTQKLDNLTNSDFPDQFISPTQFAQYSVIDAAGTSPFQEDQRLFSNDRDDGGLGFEQLGATAATTFTVDAAGNLKVTLSNLDGTGQHQVIAGPVLFEKVSDGSTFRIQNDRDPETLAPVATPNRTYTETVPGVWVDMVYAGGNGNDPLWESEMLRPAFRALFTDWADGGLDFPALGDTTSPDPNVTPIAKVELPSHATPFGPVVPDHQLDIPIPAGLEDAIIAGLSGLVDFAETIESSSPLQVTIPGINKSIADLIDLRGAVQTKVQQPIVDYFAADGNHIPGGSPTFRELFQIIPPANGTWNVGDGSTFEFDYDLKAAFAANNVPFSLDDGAGGLGLKLDGALDAGASIAFVDSTDHDLPLFGFGVDMANNLDVADRFFVRTGTLLVHAEAHSDSFDLDGNLGFLSMGVQDGSFNVAADVEIALTDPTDGDGKITLSDIAGTSLAGLSSSSATGSLAADLPVVASIGSFNATATAMPRILISDGELFDSTAPDVTFQDFDQLLGFSSFDSGSILAILRSLSSRLKEIGDSSAFNFNVPFTGKRLGDALDLGLDFVDTLVNVAGDPSFSDAQSLATQLAAALGIDVSVVNPAFDPVSRELTYTIDYSKMIDESLGFSFDAGLDPLAAINAMGDLSLAGDVDFGLTFGIDVSPVSAIITATGDAPSDGNFAGEAVFQLQLGSDAPVEVRLFGTGNTSIDDLVVAVNAALVAVGLAVKAERDGDKIRLRTSSLSATPTLHITADPANPAVTALHLPASADTFDNIANHVFIRDQSLDASFNVTGDLAASATFGFVGITGELSAAGNVDFSFQPLGGARLDCSICTT